jgi:hypothetical protein
MNRKFAFAITSIILSIFFFIYSTIFFSKAISLNLVGYYFILKVLQFILILLSIGFYIWIVIQKHLNSTFVNLSISIVAVVFFFLTVELIFVFIPQSNHMQVTLASWNWQIYYDKPLNSLGFRDSKNLPDLKPNEVSIFFIGDSYTEGYGIKKVQNRYSDLVAEKLGSNYNVYNLGKSGSALTEQIETMKSIPFLPNIIVWQFFFNDIDDICYELGFPYPSLNPYQKLNSVNRFFIENSYLANFLYFRFAKMTSEVNYIDYVNLCSEDERLQLKLKEKLDYIKSHFTSDSTRLVFIMLPSAFDADMCKKTYNIAENIFHDLKIEYIDFREILRESKQFEFAVNHWDMHLNDNANMIISESLYWYVTNNIKANYENKELVLYTE